MRGTEHQNGNVSRPRLRFDERVYSFAVREGEIQEDRGDARALQAFQPLRKRRDPLRVACGRERLQNFYRGLRIALDQQHGIA